MEFVSIPKVNIKHEVLYPLPSKITEKQEFHRSRIKEMKFKEKKKSNLCFFLCNKLQPQNYI